MQNLKKSFFKYLWLFLVKSKIFRVGIVSTTVAGKKSYLTHNIDSKKIFVLPNGADLNLFKKQSSATDFRKSLKPPLHQKIICFCGSLYSGRGIDEIIYSIERIPDAFFLIVGGPEKDADKYQIIASKKKLKNCKFTGHVPQEDVPKYLMASDILLMPYTRKTAHPYMSPMKMFDYIAAGKAIIATDFPVVHEILKNEETALFVKPDDKEDLYVAIQKLLNTESLYKKLCDNVVAIRDKYSWSLRAKKIIDIHYKNLSELK